MARLRVRVSPQPCLMALVQARLAGVTRSEAAKRCMITYWSARYWLDKKVDEGLIKVDRVWTIRGFVRRVVYYPVIPARDMVDVTIVIYSVCRGKKAEYDYRFQGFFDVDALKDVVTGRIIFDSELTMREIRECLMDFRMRWGWDLYGTPAPGTEEPVWVETSEFEYILEPRGASLKGLSKIEDDEETYWRAVVETIYRPTDEEKEEFKKLVGRS